MKAEELRVGKHFRVVGLPLWWKVIASGDSGVFVRPIQSESRTFSTAGNEEVVITFRPRAFYISRETLVEVQG